MGFRFFRRMNIAPGVRLNFSKSGISPSFGVRGARITLGRGGVRKTVGIPGTGLFYTEVSGTGTRRGRRRGQADAPPSPQHRLDLGFFERLLTPKDERAFVDGCKEYVAGRKEQALVHLRQAVHLADGAFLAGFLALEAGRFAEAATYLKQAAGRAAWLGRHFAKYGLNVQLSLPITEEVTAHITPSHRGALLGLVEAYQRQGGVKEALECLKQLRRETPDDVVVNLSMGTERQTPGQADCNAGRRREERILRPRSLDALQGPGTADAGAEHRGEGGFDGSVAEEAWPQ